MKLLCFDGNSVVNRAFYGIKLLTTKDGRYTNAIFGFLNIFLKLLDEQRPDAVAVAFDLPVPTFRHRMYDGYKGTRKGMPEELAMQMPVLKELLSALGYRAVSAEGYEADDILGTFAELCEQERWQCVIATGDRDSLQLVSGSTEVLLTTTQFGRGETAVMNAARIEEDYGLSPERLIDVKALMGDSSDNVPGVGGVGEKTALLLIQSFGSLDGVYENIDSDLIKPGIRQKLLKDREQAYLSRELVTICRTAPVETDLFTYYKQPGDPEKAGRMLSELEMHSLREKLSLTAPEPVEIPRPEEKIAPVELTEAHLASLLEISVLPGEDGFYLSEGRTFYRAPKELFKRALAKGIRINCGDAKALHRFALDAGIEAENIVFDLALAGYLLNPSSPSYEPLRLAAEYGVKPLFENDLLPAMGVMEPLAAELKKRLLEADMLALLRDIELPLARVLASMEREGFLVDTAGIRAFGDMLIQKIGEEQAEIYRMVGREFNINSPKQLGEALFLDLNLPVGKKTKSGYSTGAEVLEKLRGRHPVIAHILAYRTYGKLNSTYVEGLLKAADATGRIHTDFRQTETRTGRISSTNPNLQNIPVRTELGSRLRRYFIAEAGNILLDADYSQIELRVLAGISGDCRMIEAFREDHDIHTETASEVFRVPREMVTSEMRRRAKAVNFGIVYGIGAFSLAEDIGVPIPEANAYIENYLETYSGVRQYLRRTVEEAEKSGYVTTLFGRRRQLPELSNSNRQVQALGKRLAMNTPIQGTAADIIKIAMIRVFHRLKEENLDAKLILQVHDELIVEASEGDAVRAAAVLKEEMERAAELSAPLVAEVGKGESWYDAK